MLDSHYPRPAACFSPSKTCSFPAWHNQSDKHMAAEKRTAARCRAGAGGRSRERSAAALPRGYGSGIDRRRPSERTAW
jgi:hypothetical protein